MKKRILLLISGFLSAALFCACTKEQPTVPHIVRNGQLWEINTEETYSMALEEDAVLIDVTLIHPDTLPTREGECNARAGTAQVYEFSEEPGDFMVILDGNQYPVQ